jgi:ABC-2 type transport system permease protein
MSKAWTIAKREFLAYFNSPVAYIVVCLFLLLVGVLFWWPFFVPGRLSMRDFFSIVPLVFVVYAPAVTMRLLAEERGSGTLEVLATMPVRDVAIVVGKYLAALGLLVVTLLMTVPYAISLAWLGDLDMGPVVGGYVGLFLIGGAYLAIGLFFSSLTQHQMVAFFAALIICLAFFLMDKFIPLVPTGIASLVEYLSFDFHYRNIARGVVDTRNVIFFLSVIGLSLTASYAALESRRWWR